MTITLRDKRTFVLNSDTLYKRWQYSNLSLNAFIAKFEGDILREWSGSNEPQEGDDEGDADDQLR